MRTNLRDKIHLLLVSFLLFSLLLTPQVARAQAAAPAPALDPLEKCRRIAFSTEEDFMMTDNKQMCIRDRSSRMVLAIVPLRSIPPLA